jgi:hypothetical protein
MMSLPHHPAFFLFHPSLLSPLFFRRHCARHRTGQSFTFNTKDHLQAKPFACTRIHVVWQGQPWLVAIAGGEPLVVTLIVDNVSMKLQYLKTA